MRNLNVLCWLAFAFQAAACGTGGGDAPADDNGTSDSGSVQPDAGKPRLDGGYDDGECDPGVTRSCGTQGNEVSACRSGVQTCNADGAWGTCEGAVGPSEEVCDGIDNDCDGVIDENVLLTFSRDADGDGFGGATTQEACQDPDGAGTEWIAAGELDCDDDNALTFPGNGAEVCDGIDNDCANGIDDGMFPLPAANTEGACSANVLICDGPNGYVEDPNNHVPTAEVCDGIDNDCANGVDNAVPSLNLEGACSRNVLICDGTNGYVDHPANHQIVPEICDGIDNDCANGVDDGLDVAAVNTQGACAGNVRSCDGANGWVENPNNYIPSPEVCDGIDNDCLNGIDDGLGELPSANTQGACRNNVRFCYGANGYVEKLSNYQPTTEVCDGVDNDCANGVDDGMTPIAAANTQGACAGNTQVCDGANGYVDRASNYVPKAETCDGIDNDCESGIDNGLGPIAAANIEGACSANTRVCSGAGGYVNSPGNYVPQAEVCDGVDNDCANGIDNGMAPIPAANVAGACSTNTQVCLGVSGYVNRADNYVPTPEVCDGIDNDCAGGIDNGLVPIAASNILGACAGNTRFCNGAAGYVNTASNYVPVADTSCNNVDEDCDGLSDEGYIPSSLCFKPGECASGNVASSCAAGGVETACKSGIPPEEEDLCEGKDDNCDGKTEQYCWDQVTSGQPTTCGGCYKDVHAGRYFYCDGSIAGSTKTNCEWGGNNCTFPADTNVTEAECRTLCEQEPGCHFFTTHYGSVCNLHLTTTCNQVSTGAPGNIYYTAGCIPTAANDVTCDGKDDDCSGEADEDWVPDTSCFLQGSCAAGNQASTCNAGVETACEADAPPTMFDLCKGADDNCDGTVDTECWSQVTSNQPLTCGGCYKDIFSGRYNYCNGTYPQATKTGCDWTGGGTGCTFAPDKQVTAEECRTLCENEPGCYFVTSIQNSICNLHMMTACNQQPASTGSIFKSPATCIPTAASDTTCNGVDDDCNGQVDEDWVPNTSCFLSGSCAAGNKASSCSNGVETPCATGTRPFVEDQCEGNDDNCDGTVDTVCFDKITSNQNLTCAGCYKDMFAGRYVYCDGTYPKATYNNCSWSGDNCTFPADKAVTAEECKDLCEQEPGCYFATSHYDSICNLHMMTECTQTGTGAPGSIYQKAVDCLPTAANDITCNGVDDDCDGQVDEDWVPNTSCFLPGVCAAGNKASICTAGVEQACSTGTPGPRDLCTGKDDNCDGTVSTVCYNQLTTNETSTCGGCYKDMFAGRYTYCNGTYPQATKTGCDWVGGSGSCTFPADTQVTAAECQTLCVNEPGCYFATSYGNSICNLHLMTSCVRQNTGASGSIFAKEVACIPTATTDTTCNGVDEDCSGTADEDWVADTSCFEPGVCAAGNVASTCQGGVLTACKTGAPTSAFDMCQGKDDNCDGLVETACWTEISSGSQTTCGGCRKDMFAGQYVYCNGTYESATHTGCDWIGGPGSCTFPRQTSVTAAQCRELCEDEPGCAYVTSYYDSICNLHLMTSCVEEQSAAPGNIYAAPDACIPIYSDDSTCDGVDDDCDGQIDEDFVGSTSCFKPGACSAGNVASSCNGGVETACKTGAPTAAKDQCGGVDDNCDGTVETVCYTQLTTNQTRTCGGCFKDMFAGQYKNCNGTFPAATKSGCSATGGPGDCTFPADTTVTTAECEDLCAEATGCYFFSSYNNSVCSLHFMTSCTQETASVSGSIFRKDGCIPTAATDTTCNGIDEDCSGTADEDYVPDTSCFKPGVCATGNKASSCSFGTVTACTTGAPTSTLDLCQGKDDNCDGATVCPVDTDGDGIPDVNDKCGGDDASGNTDGDRFCNDSDNCPTIANSDQADNDRDGIGNVCDNCPNLASSDQTDSDHDGIGNVCDPDYQLPPQGNPNAPVNPQRPACGFTPMCPSNAPGVTRYNSYLFSCYADEPNNGGNQCLGDRWWYHLNRRIYPMMVGDQPLWAEDPDKPGTYYMTVEGFLEELERPELNVPGKACTSSAACSGNATCTEGVCLYPEMKNFIDRLSESSNFLSCTGAASYENKWPADRVTKLDNGPCGWQTFGWKSIYGYTVVNRLEAPMTIWVGRGASSGTGDADKRWWTLNPGERISFNAYDDAYIFPTGAAAYNTCQPSFMKKTVHSENLTPPSFTQVARVPMVTYRVTDDPDPTHTLVVYRDKYLKSDFDLFAWPNYFGVGLGPKGTNGNKSLHGFMATAIPPSAGARYPELSCR